MTQQDVRMLLDRSRAAYARGDLAGAEQVLTRAAELDGKTPEIQHFLGNVCQELGQLDRAISCYRRAIRIQPGFAEAHNDLGTAYFSKGMHQEAVASYLQAVSARPDHHVAYTNLGEAFMKLGDYANARKHIRTGLRLRFRSLLRRLFRWAS
jgi:Flp pilus assembly protein TadD